MKKIRTLAAVLLIVCMMASLAVPAAAVPADQWWLKKYPDPHFNPANEPNRVATVEEAVAILCTRGWWAEGSDAPAPADKSGKTPSAWCARYVSGEMNKGDIKNMLRNYNYSDPATIAFLAEFLARSKGKYQYDYENAYSFSYTSGLSAEQKMFLNVAADYKLIPYTAGMNAVAQVTRAQLEGYIDIFAKTEGLVTPTAPTPGSNGGMKENHVYFRNDTPGDQEADDQLQLSRLKSYGSDITMVTFQAANISTLPGPNNGLEQLIDSAFLDNSSSRSYLRDYVGSSAIKEAIAYCNENGITPLLGVQNFGSSGFDAAKVVSMLSSESAMDTAIGEIVACAAKYNLKGVNIGFEHIPASARTGFVRFLTKLNTVLDQRGMLLMTSVGAYFKENEEEASPYDYPGIAAVSDYVHVILYDDHPDTAYNAWQCDVGVISSMVNIDRVLKYVTNRIGGDKVLLGMATFAVDFNPAKHKAEDVDRQSVVSKGAITELTDGTMGAKISAGGHEIYLESDNGIRQRILRAYRYKLCGISSYCLEFDHPTLMRASTEYSANKAEVMNAVKANLVPNGMRSGYTSSITRAQFCDLVVNVITAKTGKTIDQFLAEKGKSVSSGKFSDTTSHNVLAAEALGIVSGKGDGKFKPGDPIKRKEAAKMLMGLAKTLGKDTAGAGQSFTDIGGEQPWATESIAYITAVKDPTNSKSVMGGTGNGKFSPNGTYTREQAYMTAIRLYHAL